VVDPSRKETQPAFIPENYFTSDKRDFRNFGPAPNEEKPVAPKKIQDKIFSSEISTQTCSVEIFFVS
jgi:hypothetical protein